jgi:hypothetical protein
MRQMREFILLCLLTKMPRLLKKEGGEMENRTSEPALLFKPTQCRYSAATEPCVVRNRTDELCKVCLSQNTCPNCGINTLQEFRLTNKPHLCPGTRMNEDGQVMTEGE